MTGPVFGLVVLIWDSEMPGDIFRLKNVPFLTASTLIYACVFWIASRDFGYNSTFWEIFTGSSSWGVLLGSLLMPQAHRNLVKRQLLQVGVHADGHCSARAERGEQQLIQRGPGLGAMGQWRLFSS